ncbi:tetratricopeptide repeat protein [Candidatus Collierbacteria bacterium]|nr:tetratricopeptide repeat protein [Candidatus Collierbacteria bacterium]
MKTKWAILILILAGFIAYGNTLKNGLFWDDDEFIKRNEFIRSFSQWPNWLTKPLTAGAGVNSNYYRPFLMASFTVDYHLWGLWPAGYHFENILWHTAAGILLYIFLKEFLQKFSIQHSVFSIESKIAFSTALLWLVHPIHVEAIAYANSRGDSMATFFILLSLILWLKNKIKGSAIAFILALLSKEFAIVTPGLILLIESLRGASATWQSREIPTTPKTGFRNDGKAKAFLAITSIAITYIFLRLTALNFQNTLNFYGTDLTKTDQNQPFARYAASLPVRLITFMKILPIYAGILVWPNNLHMERTVEMPASIADSGVLIPFSAVSLLIVFCFLFIRKSSIPAFAAGWFFISIVPVSGIIPISQILAEHFLYLPSIGFFLIISWLVFSLIFKLIKSEKWRRISLFFVFCSLFFPLLLKTIRQNRVWRDPITFYEYTLAHAQPTARVYNNLAMAYADIKNHDKAIENYQKSIALGDIYPNPHYNLGNTFVETGELNKAEEEYKKALKIDPNFSYALLKLGQIYS